jgi:hypothetical protein
VLLAQVNRADQVQEVEGDDPVRLAVLVVVAGRVLGW